MKFDKYIKYTDNGSFHVENLPEEDKYKQCAYFIREAKNICILTGAGISTNAEIPDFRSKTGWYSKEPENLLSFSNFIKRPKEVYNFLYKYYKLINVEPTVSHDIIAKLENMNKNITVITQNIDKLHKKAGSTEVIEYHGSLDKANCLMCNKEYNIELVLNEYIDEEEFTYKCVCGGYIKPNITLFEENVQEDSFARKEISKADLLIIIGSSLKVAPFSELPFNAPLEAPFIIINKDSTYLDDNRMSVVINSDCDKALKRIMKNL